MAASGGKDCVCKQAYGTMSNTAEVQGHNACRLVTHWKSILYGLR
jgi:hypothetical protein